MNELGTAKISNNALSQYNPTDWSYERRAGRAFHKKMPFSIITIYCDHDMLTYADIRTGRPNETMHILVFGARYPYPLLLLNGPVIDTYFDTSTLASISLERSDLWPKIRIRTSVAMPAEGPYMNALWLLPPDRKETKEFKRKMEEQRKIDYDNFYEKQLSWKAFIPFTYHTNATRNIHGYAYGPQRLLRNFRLVIDTFEPITPTTYAVLRNDTQTDTTYLMPLSFYVHEIFLAMGEDVMGHCLSVQAALLMISPAIWPQMYSEYTVGVRKRPQW